MGEKHAVSPEELDRVRGRTAGFADGESDEPLWSGGPHPLKEVWVWAGIIAVHQALSAAAPFAARRLPQVSVPDTWAETVSPAGVSAPGAVALALCAVALWRLLAIHMTDYAITERYLHHANGVIFRKHDRVELHRVRDVQVVRPLHMRVLGLGHVVVHSVDRSSPLTSLRAQRRAVDLGDALYERVKAEQDRIGYREFEGTG